MNDRGRVCARGLLVAGAASGVGKTIVTVGLARAAARRGLRVRTVKSGPDYIDGAFGTAATGRPALNLDTFAMPPDLLAGLAAHAARDTDLVVAEGAMGLHDGVGQAPGSTGSAADLAARLGWPILLVVDTTGQGATAAAVAHGLATFDGRLRIAGIVLNRVASERHRAMAEAGFAGLDLPVFGALPRHEGASWPARHLGLVGAGETADLSGRLDALADLVERHVDLDRVLAAAEPLPAIDGGPSVGPAIAPPGQRIALARDEAFPFVYPHVLLGWREAGATVLPFSPLADEPPPDDADCCWLPGGYPELHAGRLAAAERFRDGVSVFSRSRPVHGECGGYMVLGEALQDADGTWHRMAGCLPVRTSFARRRLHLGYRTATLTEACPLGPPGTVLSGHEFHYASVCPDGSAPANLAFLANAGGTDLGPAGHRRGLVSGTFFHAIARREALAH